ncbi:hypothetical protein [Rheinheimera sp.]|jgi:hypothetical protein|uniref:hypothetical protein n=1 Tax=Rheinheimera sp. TaxID=1869214 RepID=UPI003D281655
MPKISLQKIIVLPDFLAADAYANSKRLFDILHRRGDSSLLETLLSNIRVLEYQKEFYALEQHNLIAVAAEQLPRFDATVVIVSKAKSKPELMRQLLNIASIQYVTQRSAAATPAWHQAVADDYAIEQLFSMRQWSEIIDRHRSAVYRRKPKLQKKKSITTVDIQRVLKAIPSPRGDGK